MYLNAENQEIGGSSASGWVVGVMEYQASEPGLNPSVVTFLFSAGWIACASMCPVTDE